MLMQKFWVTKKEHYGMLWYFLEWSFVLLYCKSEDLTYRNGYYQTLSPITVLQTIVKLKNNKQTNKQNDKAINVVSDD